jgi:Papain family cysteine protease
MDGAFTYAHYTPLETEGEYPYTARDGACQYRGDGVVDVINYYNVQPDNPSALYQALR